jgi:glycosyltransferase involved in cell wall biosynthesis
VTTDQRPLRILHIGNVANYGYNIGKILNTKEFISHAISWDYYHINAQPVWEEGVFDASAVGDQYFPQLPSASDAGFTAPDWYVQGPRVLACLTLIARNEGKHGRAAFFQRALDNHLAKLHDPAYRAALAAGRQRAMEVAYTDLLGGFGKIETGSALRRFGIRLLGSTGASAIGVRGMAAARNRASAAKWVVLNRVAATRNRAGAAKWIVLNRLDAVRTLAMRRGAKLPAPIKQSIKRALYRSGGAAPMPEQPQSAQIGALKDASALLRQNEQIVVVAAPVHTAQPAPAALPQSPFEAHVQALIAQYKSIYPERDFDQMLLRQYEHTLPLMRRLFSHYDLVIGYAIEGIWPLMAGVPYVAYEFGTIRNLPFQDTATGRLAALTYLNCEQIIVTNSDNEAPAKRLGRPYFFLPHVVNESGLLNADEAATARADFLAEHSGDFVVFHPPRQHWDEKRDTSWDKGNDHLFHGFARLVKQHAPNARCITVAWGESLARSKELIAELGITENVIWITPQPHIAMMRYIAICDVLCDQFTIPTFGGIPPKAFHAGKPVVTSFDPELHRWCFDKLPPLIPANSADKVYDALARLYTDKPYAMELGRRGADWYRRENSNARVREVLLQKLKGLQGRN